MEIDFIIGTLEFGSIVLSNQVPTELEGFHIPGSKVFSSRDKFGVFLIQLVELNGSGWLYSVFIIEENITFVVSASRSFSLIHISIKGNFEHEIREAGNMIVKESTYKIVYAPSLYTTTLFKKNHHYIALDIYYPVDFMLHTMDFFPSLYKFRDGTKTNNFQFIPIENLYVSGSIAALINKMIHSPYSQNVRSFHLNIVRELLSEMLAHISTDIAQNKILIHQVEAIYAAREFINTHLSEHFSIEYISRKIGINKQDLMKGFKQVFGMGLFEYLLAERLKIARLTIEETSKSVKDIARTAGYKSTSNFSTAFKKMFGKTPLEWRKDFKNEY